MEPHPPLVAAGSSPTSETNTSRATMQPTPCRFHVGTSGWVYRHWRGTFYPRELPQKRWFQYYASQFDTVEINNTFYRMPGETAMIRWREQAPPGFVYAVKASRFLTHVKRLREPREPLHKILDNAALLGEHLGPILVQFPESFHKSDLNFERLRLFVDLVPPRPDFVLEFRHPGWFADDVYGLMAGKRIALCIVSDPAWPTDFQVTGDIVYVRFHGPKDARYHGRYPLSEIEEWVDRIRSLIGPRQAYVYFNNDWNAHAVENAREFRTLIAPAGRGRTGAS
jgi:uncharacterized protein YecE (DUF72 family)